MSDVRLIAGEGKLSASTVLQACNVIMKQRSALPLTDQVVPTWLDIESAPKDGTAILGVWWADISADTNPQPKIGIVWWAGAWCPYARTITHWMPLPAAPVRGRTG